MNKKKIVLFSVAALGFIALSGILLVPPEKSYDAGMVSVCSEITKDNMKSPSSYRLGKSIVVTKVLTQDEAISRLYKGSGSPLKKYINDGSLKMYLSDAYVDYEAENSFGTLIKNTAICQYQYLQPTSSPSFEMIQYHLGGKVIEGTDLLIVSGAKDHRIGKNSIIQKMRYIHYKISGIF
ncbi:hypothetical protein [Pantoea sp. 1.19]|uniref:hypothetical protein n=1 Tax=Pantoea sp. 1.19 TaxID=1925589 RepID=UPI0009491FA4|nr:hypothetical protein [Pantoea sp. 1.19]